MYCKFCGMDSRDARVCEWCKKPLAAGPAAPAGYQPQPLTGQPLGGPLAPAPPPAGQPHVQPTPPSALPSYLQPSPGQASVQPLQPVGAAPAPAGIELTQPVAVPLDLTQPVQPPTPGASLKMSLTGEVMEVPQTTARPIPGAYSRPSMVAPGERPVSTVPGILREMPAHAVTAQMVQQQARFEDDDLGERWDKALAIAFPIILLAVVGVRFAPQYYLWIECGALFLIALSLGSTRAIGTYDDILLDCVFVFCVSCGVGPIVAFGLYLIYGAVRSEPSGAINFLGLFHVVTRLLLVLAASRTSAVALYGPEIDFKAVLPHVPGFSNIGNLLGALAVFATFAGWGMSSFFRPVDE